MSVSERRIVDAIRVLSEELPKQPAVMRSHLQACLGAAEGYLNFKSEGRTKNLQNEDVKRFLALFDTMKEGGLRYDDALEMAKEFQG